MQIYGLPVGEAKVAATAQECVAAVSGLAGPAALKIVSPRIVHKSDVGGVILNVMPDTAADAFARLAGVGRRAGDPESRVIVSPMAKKGVELVMGAFRDPNFGPVVMLGIGGVLVEILSDVTFRMAPLSRADAVDMVAGLRSRALLDGFRGSPAVDRKAVADAMVRLSRLISDHAGITEIDVNPVIANADGLTIVDARIITKGR
jgi:acetyltransferase